jgi:hypothetical protein
MRDFQLTDKYKFRARVRGRIQHPVNHQFCYQLGRLFAERLKIKRNAQAPSFMWRAIR